MKNYRAAAEAPQPQVGSPQSTKIGKWRVPQEEEEEEGEGSREQKTV
jgi:hypothetical protein